MNEHELEQNHSGKSEQTTRVISHKKQARKTVGITINPKILEKARNRNLNISRICEQALASIIDYIPRQNETASSKFLTGCSLQRENPRADSSAWYERRIRNAEVAGSNPARSTETSLGKKFHQEIQLFSGLKLLGSRILSLRLVRIFGLCLASCF